MLNVKIVVKPKDLIRHLSDLSKIPLNLDEEKEFANQVIKIIDYIGEVQKVSVGKLKPTFQVTGKSNEFREDKVTPCLSQEVALSQANFGTHNGFFVTKALLDK